MEHRRRVGDGPDHSFVEELEELRGVHSGRAAIRVGIAAKCIDRHARRQRGRALDRILPAVPVAVVAARREDRVDAIRVALMREGREALVVQRRPDLAPVVAGRLSEFRDEALTARLVCGSGHDRVVVTRLAGIVGVERAHPARRQRAGHVLTPRRPVEQRVVDHERPRVDGHRLRRANDPDPGGLALARPSAAREPPPAACSRR